MPERVRLYRDDEQQPDQTDESVMQVGIELGFLHLELQTTDDTDHHRWRAKVRGSDYLVWGMNHQQVIIEFQSGERRRAVVRATGDVIGLGPAPTLTPSTETTPQ